ncbi:MAG: serine/threonine protein, partial [Planctomycetota bacterium]
MAWLPVTIRISNMPSPTPHDRYRLGAEIAKGGLGRIFAAEDAVLGREVAVKVMREGLSAESEARFVREARVTARLQHPNIIPVLDFGELPGKDGRRKLFLCMKRIGGMDLRDLLSRLAGGNEELRRTYSRARLLAMFQEVCLAVAYAHSKGVVHRDLKPANIMVGEFGEVLVLDWGLASEKRQGMGKVREGGEGGLGPGMGMGQKDVMGEVVDGSGAHDSTHVPSPGGITRAGDVMGTPAYMAPEQALGDAAAIDERTDIFALGTILYEILTFRPAISGDSMEEILDRARSGIVAPISGAHASHRRGDLHSDLHAVPPELESICMKALAPRREDRFPSALSLHAAIQSFLEGAQDLERRAAEALKRLEAGRGFAGEYLRLRGEIDAAAAEVEMLHEKIPSHEPAAKKRPLWDAEARLRALRDRRIEKFTRASAEFSGALAADAGCAEAADGLCELYHERFLEAEKRRDRDEMLLNRRLLESHDGAGRWRARLDAPGRLTVRAFAFGCGCLKAAPGLRAE